MSADFDPGMAWDIADWGHGLGRAEIESLAAFLKEKGYSKHKASTSTNPIPDLLSNLRASGSYLEEVGAKLADEYLPLFEQLFKQQKRKE